MIANLYDPIEGWRHDCTLVRKTCEWPGTLFGDPANPLRRHLQSPFSRVQLYNG